MINSLINVQNELLKTALTELLNEVSNLAIYCDYENFDMGDLCPAFTAFIGQRFELEIIATDSLTIDGEKVNDDQIDDQFYTIIIADYEGYLVAGYFDNKQTKIKDHVLMSVYGLANAKKIIGFLTAELYTCDGI